MADQPTAQKTTFRTVFEVGPDALAQTQRMADAFQHAVAPATVDYDFGEIGRAAGRSPAARSSRSSAAGGSRRPLPSASWRSRSGRPSAKH
ncbi:hypothetical protein [Streptomyces sirii]|uniref:hypothetical protein n=1 Tax=Streptomyces sirii TaxID=3127701 RepID=UPI003D35E707